MMKDIFNPSQEIDPNKVPSFEVPPHNYDIESDLKPWEKISYTLFER